MHTTSGDATTYRYSRAGRSLMDVCAFGLLSLPVLPILDGQHPPIWFFVLFAGAAAAAGAAAVYCFRYRVIIDGSALSFGASRLRSVPLTDIVDTDITTGRYGRLLVYLRGGRRLQFSNSLDDFDSLRATLSARCTGVSPSTGASIEKLQDQRKRMARVHRVRWIGGMGLLIIVIIVLWSRI